jgi:hypothetical protein
MQIRRVCVEVLAEMSAHSIDREKERTTEGLDEMAIS